MNIRIKAENYLMAAFQFWKIPKVQTRLEGMVDFLYDVKYYDKDKKKHSGNH